MAKTSELTAQADAAAEQAAARAIVTLVNRRLMTLDPAQVLQISTSVPFRELAVTTWLHSHDPAPERGEQFARDPARSVRLAVAEALPRLRTVAAGVVEPLLARLRHDPSARVRRTVSENSNRAA